MKVCFKILLCVVFATVILSSCNHNNKDKIVIFHAGSLAMPFHQVANEFQIKHPEINVFIEQSGSLAAARKITDLNKKCDILAVADYLIIDNLMIPQHANWNYIFATNEMIIAYNNKSKYADKINSDNWHNIILKDDVRIGRSEPNLDPCGYRTLFVFKLAEKLYNHKGLAEILINKTQTVIRPKEVDLIAVLETGNIDYLFIYKSVAIQHNLKFIELAPEINLSDPYFDSLYNTVSTIVDGATYGEKLEIYGSSILYGFCIPENHQNYDDALKFALFLIHPEQGGKILRNNGMTPVNYVTNKYINNLPDKLKSAIHSH